MEGKTSTTHRIRDMRGEEKPRERMAALGAGALHTYELLAILLRVGMQGENVLDLSKRLLDEFGGLAGLHSADLEQLADVHGMGLSKACQLKAALEIGYRLQNDKPDEKPQINSPADAAALVMHQLSAATQEELWVLLLNTRNRVLSKQHLYTGSINHSTVRVAEVFTAAIRQKAAAVIVAHNHPSGDPAPSPEDIQLTVAMRQAGELLDIKLLDHLIIGRQEWVSLKQRRLGFD